MPARTRLRSGSVALACLPMSATEIIERIKTLPVAEQKAVMAFVSDLQDRPVASSGPQRMDRKTFEQAKEVVFRKHDEAFRRLAQ